MTTSTPPELDDCGHSGSEWCDHYGEVEKWFLENHGENDGMGSDLWRCYVLDRADQAGSGWMTCGEPECSWNMQSLCVGGYDSNPCLHLTDEDEREARREAHQSETQTCDRCGGNGWEPCDEDHRMHECPVCGGLGDVEVDI